MRVDFRGGGEKPSLIAVGTWDPLVIAHRRLIKRLVTTAAQKKLTPTIVLLHPPPAAHLHDLQNWPIYDDIEARVWWLEQLGVAAPVVVRFSKEDLEYGAGELFSILETNSRIEEVWLGPTQTLGRGEASAPVTIARLASRKGIRLVRLSPDHGLTRAGFAREAVQAGRLRAAARIAGHPPTWMRPRSGRLRLSWPAGRYKVIPLNQPTFSSQIKGIGAPITVHLRWDGRGRNVTKWPDESVEWIAFVSGPGDIRKPQIQAIRCRTGMG